MSVSDGITPPPYTAQPQPPPRASGWGGHKGYEPVPQEMDNYPPNKPQYEHNPYAARMPQPSVPPPMAYAPAPPVFNQQQSSNNVVVVGQQPAAPAPAQIVHVERPTANSHLALTLVLMVLCFFHGNLPAFVFLVPALICACSASDHNNSGDYEGARSCGNAALCCNILSIVYFLLLFLAGVAMIVVYFTVGFAFITGIVVEPTISTPCEFPWTCK